jgi:hypothetical protein
LRAKEIAELTWSMVTDASGEIADAISLPNSASKGKNGGRTIPLHGELREALVALKAARGVSHTVVYSERAISAPYDQANAGSGRGAQGRWRTRVSSAVGRAT